MRDGPSGADPLRRFDQTAAFRGGADKILATQNRVLQLIATGEPFEKVLEALVGAVEAHCEGAIGSLLLIDDDGEHLRHGVAPRLPESLRHVLDGMRIGPAAGSAGTAAYRGRPVVVEDISTDPLWEDHRDLALEQGLRACWSQPIFSSERKVAGAFALYYTEPRAPTEAELDLVDAVAYLAGIAVERHRAERGRRASERRLLRQKTVLIELATCAPGDFLSLCKRATEAAAETLGVQRVSIWLLNDERTVLRCESLFELSLDRHSSGPELESNKYPRYFSALERGRSVVAHDACRDADTSEFSETYLTPLGITSMLDAPIRRSGRLVGVVCHEHVGPRRVWAADEQDFAASIGDFVSLGLEAAERRRAQQAFRSAQEDLLRQDFQARRQIEFELDRMKDELVRQTRLATIGQVAASIAHELRNPLGVIRNAVFYLRRRVPPDEPKWIEYFDIIDQEICRADITINDLLEMSQAKEPVKEAVNLAEVVRDSFGYVRPNEDVRLRLVVDPDPFMVDADAGQLRQVVTNLMSNSVEALQGAGRITVEARHDDGFDVITVGDDGRGVAESLRERIFEPLVTTKVKGTGLGLPICRQIAKRHGGTIECVPSGERGATFRLRLPKSRPA